MKKIAFLFMFMMLPFTSSCDGYQAVSYDFGAFSDYSYNGTPVYLRDGAYYWYVMTNNVWHYQPLPLEYWGFVYRNGRQAPMPPMRRDAPVAPRKPEVRPIPRPNPNPDPRGRVVPHDRGGAARINIQPNKPMRRSERNGK